MPKKIIFRGYLQQMYPEGILLEADSAAEALEGLRMYPGFREEDAPHPEFHHALILPDFQSLDAFYAPTDRQEILVEPFLAGSGGKRGAWLQIGIGIALVAFAAPLGAAVAGLSAGAAGASAAAIAAASTNIVMAGAMMILGGLVSILMPQPAMSGSGNVDDKSNYLGGSGGNTVASGTPIPLLLGTHKCSGHYLSFNITATNLKDPGPPAVVDTYPSIFSATVDKDFNITVNNTGVVA